LRALLFLVLSLFVMLKTTSLSKIEVPQANLPACVSMEQAATIFGWPNYYLPFLVRAGHLKPLGNQRRTPGNDSLPSKSNA
jgi:hypothetical protein